jgi:hypothetical protein
LQRRWHFFETNKEPAGSAEEEKLTLGSASADENLAHLTDETLGETRTTFSELTGRSLKVAGLD